MNSIARRAVSRPIMHSLRQVRNARLASTAPSPTEATQTDRELGKTAMKQGAKRDPELYVLGAIMCGAFGLAGWYFSSSPTSAISEEKVSKIPGSEPWQSGTSGKYQYHPGGDPSAGRKDAPSALHTTIIPNVNLPKHLHDKYNKYGKEDFS